MKSSLFRWGNDKGKKVVSKNVIIKAFFLVLSLVIFVFCLANQNAINFAYNGFNKIFASELQVYFFDVGQANASLILFPNGISMVVDAGSGKTDKNFVGELSFVMKKNNVDEIDILLLSHPDEDHIGGAILLLQTFQVNKF